MQPNQDDDTWQKPSEQPSQAPYTTTPVASDTPTAQPAPVVSMTPDAVGGDDIPSSPLPDDTGSPVNPPIEPIHWQAQEYIHHERNTLWFVLFALVVVGLMAAAIFLMDALSFAILVPVMAAALLVYIHRPPRILDYTLGAKGLHINDRLYSFAEFKGFGIIRDGEEYSVMLIPTKRFKPGVVVYFPEEAGEAIIDMLGARLPMLKLELDIVDQIIRKLRI